MIKKLRDFDVFLVSLIRRHPCLAAMVLCAGMGMAASLAGFPEQQSSLGWCFVGIGSGLGGGWVILRLKKRLNSASNIGILWGMGVFLRLSHILLQPYASMQHDVNVFTSDQGHAAYIMYLFREGHLPDFDVREVWQFYHPPLHHLICAGWMHVMSALGLEGETLYESIQTVPFIWSCMALMVFVLILRELGIKGDALALPLAIMAVHPIFLILSGSLNNDMLSILLMLTAMLHTIRWYKLPTMRNIIPLALAIGLGMMTKLSAWMTAPMAALVFLTVLFRKRNNPLPYLRQFGIFLTLCVPTALWWEIRNWIRWQVPVTYIPMLSNDSKQYVGDHSLWERLLDFSSQQFANVYDCFTMYGQAYNEYNPLIGMLKTAVFDEFVTLERTPAVAGFGDVLFWSQVLLAAGTFICMVHVLRKGKTDRIIKIGLFATSLIMLVSYYSFCISFAHTCTQSARYATPVIYVSLIFLGLWQQEAKGRHTVILRRYITAAAGMFMAMSMLIYGLLIYLG